MAAASSVRLNNSAKIRPRQKVAIVWDVVGKKCWLRAVRLRVVRVVLRITPKIRRHCKAHATDGGAATLA
jgi:hypothetical protein